jgi:hypothetical protein
MPDPMHEYAFVDSTRQVKAAGSNRSDQDPMVG